MYADVTDVDRDVIMAAYADVYFFEYIKQYEDGGIKRRRTFKQFLAHNCGLKCISCTRGKIHTYRPASAALFGLERPRQYVTYVYRIINIDLYLAAKIKYKI
jgi:hypothetical protein